MSRQANGRSSIYLGSDGYWHGRVSVGLKDDGRLDRRHVMSRTKATVVDRVADLERDRDRGRVRKASERWTDESWLDDWLEDVARPCVREGSCEGYRAAVREHLIPGLGKHRLEKLRPEHLE